MGTSGQLETCSLPITLPRLSSSQLFAVDGWMDGGSQDTALSLSTCQTPLVTTQHSTTTPPFIPPSIPSSWSIIQSFLVEIGCCSYTIQTEVILSHALSTISNSTTRPVMANSPFCNCSLSHVCCAVLCCVVLVLCLPLTLTHATLLLNLFSLPISSLLSLVNFICLISDSFFFFFPFSYLVIYILISSYLALCHLISSHLPISPLSAYSIPSSSSASFQFFFASPLSSLSLSFIHSFILIYSIN
jgi:hypothetical protein